MATTVYTMSPALEERYVNKVTGLALASGYIKYYSDVNRAVAKQVYQRTGSPPDYSYVPLGSTVNLNINGIPVDEFGNPVKPIYNLLDENGDKELYFIEVYSSTDVLQYTQEGWPLTNVIEESADATTDVVNFIPNAQFLVHNFDSFEVGGVAETNVAPGGWIFERPDDSSATDIISFNRIDAYTQTPAGSPRYEIVLNCVSPDIGDTYKLLACRFGDVNMFASEDQNYTFQISGASKTLSNVTVNLYVLKNFGAGGDPDQVIFVGTFDLTPDVTDFNFPILFGSNEGSNIGTENDDYVEIQLRLPTGSSFSAAFTDAILVTGSITNLAYPLQTNADTTVRTYSPPVGSYEGMDYYLPLVRTPQGLAFYDAMVGIPVPSFSATLPKGYLLADGAAYLTSGYSSDFIPYRRLQQKYTTSDFQPFFGTGNDFVICGQRDGYNGSDNLFLMSNGFGTAAAVADGTTATGFTFNLVTDASSNIGFTAFKNDSNEITLRGPREIVSGGITFIPALSNFTLDNLLWSGLVKTNTYDLVTNNNSGTTGLASKYFGFDNPFTTDNYYIWFKVNGTGTDPALPGATGILVSLISSMTTDLVTSAVMCAFSGYQSTYITCTAANTVPDGAYWTFESPTTSQQYYVWYTVDGSGSDPAVVGAMGILVELLSTDTATIVANKTLAAINTYYFAVPDMQGLLIRGNDPNQTWDYPSVFASGTNPARFNINPNLNGSGAGTLQLSGVMTHRHQVTSSIQSTPGGSFPAVTLGGAATSNTRETTTNGDQGSLPESRVPTMAANWIIQY